MRLRTIFRVSNRALTPISKRRRLAVVALAAGLILTAGCGSVRGGEAAQVGDQAIKITELESYLDDYTEESGEPVRNRDASVRASQIFLDVRVQGAMIEQTADKLDVDVSEAAVTKRQAELKKARMAEYGIQDERRFVKATNLTADLLHQQARWTLLLEKIGAQLPGMAEEMPGVRTQAAALKVFGKNELPVTINPRYGTWDQQKLTQTGAGIVPEGGQLVTPAPTESDEMIVPPVGGRPAPPR